MNATPPSPESQDTSRRPGTWIAGLIVAEVTIALLYGGCLLLLGTTGGHRGARALAVPSMFLAPAFGGLAASYVWRCSKPTIVTTLVDALSITLFALLIAVIIAHEGMICLVILAPLFYCSVLAGALVGRIAFKTDRTRFYLSLLPLLALLVPGEVLTRADREDVITDELLIHAPASKVWTELTSFPQIPSAPRFWRPHHASSQAPASHPPRATPPSSRRDHTASATRSANAHKRRQINAFAPFISSQPPHPRPSAAIA